MIPPSVSYQALSNVGYSALSNAAGTGYTQQKFAFTCGCSFEINKDKLGAFKFVRDLVKDDYGDALDAHLAYDILYFSWDTYNGFCMHQGDPPYSNR